VQDATTSSNIVIAQQRRQHVHGFVTWLRELTWYDEHSLWHNRCNW